MSKRMLVNAAQAGEVRVAIVQDGVLEDLNVAIAGNELIKGNVYKARVVSVESGLQAAFVDYGAGRNGFITFHDIDKRFFTRKPKEGLAKARIQDVLDVGATMIAQVYKEEMGTKGAALTTDITLPGRYLVIMPYSGSGGVSRKIEDESTRKKLKELITKLNPPEEMGIIVRTAGVARTKTELQKDFQRLVRLWGHIQHGYQKRTLPGLVYRESDVVIRSVRDYFTDDVEEVHVDDEEVYASVVEFFEQHMPEAGSKVKLYTGKMPLFSNFGLERQFENISAHKVPLMSGGSIVINPTEALIAVDVNSGKSKGQKTQEQMAFQTNQEAAAEVARQLRLRDLGGLIVVDFIDMSDARHRRDVEKVLKQAMKMDKARVELGRISRFGLLELSRQRIKANLLSSTHSVCPMCEGSGYTLTTETAALNMLRRLQELAVSAPAGARVRGRLPVEVALRLLNRRRAAISNLEQQFDVAIEIVPDIAALSTRDAFEIITAAKEASGEEKRDRDRDRERDRGRGRGRERGRDRDRDRDRSRARPQEEREQPPPIGEEDSWEPPRIVGFIPPEKLAAADIGPEEGALVEEGFVEEAEAVEAPAAVSAETVGEERPSGKRRRRRRRRKDGAAVEAVEAAGPADSQDLEDELEAAASNEVEAEGANEAEVEVDVDAGGELEAAEEASESGEQAASAEGGDRKRRRHRRRRRRGEGADAAPAEAGSDDGVEAESVAVEDAAPADSDDVATRRRQEARDRLRQRRGAKRSPEVAPAAAQPAVAAIDEAPEAVDEAPEASAAAAARAVHRAADRLKSRFAPADKLSAALKSRAELAAATPPAPAPAAAAPKPAPTTKKAAAARSKPREKLQQKAATGEAPAAAPVAQAPEAKPQRAPTKKAAAARSKLKEKLLEKAGGVEERDAAESAAAASPPVAEAPETKPARDASRSRLKDKLRGKAAAPEEKPAPVTSRSTPEEKPRGKAAAPVEAAPEETTARAASRSKLKDKLRGKAAEATEAPVAPAAPAVPEKKPAPAASRSKLKDKLRGRAAEANEAPVAPAAAALPEKKPAPAASRSKLMDKLRGKAADKPSEKPAPTTPAAAPEAPADPTRGRAKAPTRSSAEGKPKPAAGRTRAASQKATESKSATPARKTRTTGSKKAPAEAPSEQPPEVEAAASIFATLED